MSLRRYEVFMVLFCCGSFQKNLEKLVKWRDHFISKRNTLSRIEAWPESMEIIVGKKRGCVTE
jgi:hypothetical protein